MVLYIKHLGIIREFYSIEKIPMYDNPFSDNQKIEGYNICCSSSEESDVFLFDDPVPEESVLDQALELIYKELSKGSPLIQVNITKQPEKDSA